jgi:eukaryotic-like serine/threonine-protein kinase
MRARTLLFALLCCWCVSASAQVDRAEALIASGQQHEEAGRSEPAIRDYEAARAEADRIGDQRLVAAALTHLGYVHYLRGDMDEALVILKRAFDVASANGDSKNSRTALEDIAHVYADPRVAQFDQAIDYYNQLFTAYTASGQDEDAADTLFNLASTLERKGDLTLALEMYERGLAAETKLGRAGEVAFVKRSIGITLTKLDRAAEAVPLLNEALLYFERANERSRAMMSLQSRAVAFNHLRRFDDAIHDLEQTRVFFETQRNDRFLEKTYEQLARAYVGAGRWEAAVAAKDSQLALAASLAKKTGDEQTSRLRVQFDSERKEQQNRALAKQNEYNSRIRNVQTAGLTGALLALTVVGFLATRLRGTNARLRDAQEKIASFNETSDEAMRDVRAWSKGTAADLSESIHAEDIVVYIASGEDLTPLTASQARPPRLSELTESRHRAMLKTPDGNYVFAASGLSGRTFGALLVTGKTNDWSDSERQLISTFAHQLGGALELQQVRNDLFEARERNLTARREMTQRGIRLVSVCRLCGRCFADTETSCVDDLSPLDTSRALPYRIGGRYELRRILGAGGMGEVFAAYDERLGRDVAVKVIKATQLDPDARTRFEREARAIARIDHDNVIAIYDSGELDEGSAYLVTELLRGADLGEVISRHGRGAPRQVASLVRQGVAAMTAAHRAGLVHRDIKPANLFLLEGLEGFVVKLVDFGIAKRLDFETHLTHSGAIIGTPAYMAPEQITAGTSDPKSDLYSFAAVVYEALTGVRLSGSGAGFAALWDVMATAASAPSTHRSSLTARVDQALLAALSKQPSSRPEAMAWAVEIADALEQVHDLETGWPNSLGVERPRKSSTQAITVAGDVMETLAIPPPA